MLRAFLLIVCLGYSGSAVQAGALVVRDGWKVHVTSLGYSELKKALKTSIKAHKMGLVTQASATIGAKSQGITIPGNHVYGVYRNDFARRMLKASVASGIEAPIRFYVTENDDGTSTLSYKTPTTVFSPYFDEGGEALRKLAAELDDLFALMARDAIR